MNFPYNENPIGSVEDAIRKGKPGGGYQAPCKVGVAKLDGDSHTTILRTEDANGVAPIVICLAKDQVEKLIKFLSEAVKF